MLFYPSIENNGSRVALEGRARRGKKEERKKENAEDEDVVRLFLQGGWLRIKWRGARFAR